MIWVESRIKLKVFLYEWTNTSSHNESKKVSLWAIYKELEAHNSKRKFGPELQYKNGLIKTLIARDKVCQLPVQGQWFSPGTPASSTSQTDNCDLKIVESGVKHQLNQKSNSTKIRIYASDARNLTDWLHSAY